MAAPPAAQPQPQQPVQQAPPGSSQGSSVYEVYAKNFLENEDALTRLQLAQEIRDNVEILPSTDYKSFLQFLFPVFYNLLRSSTPQFNDGTEQKTRNVLLEILNRLHNNEMLRPYTQNLLKLAMFLLEVENEENAVICLRIIIDLHKNYRPQLDQEVQPFLDIVQKIYSELPKTVASTFKESPKPQQQADGPSDSSKPTTLIRSMHSFKVLTECPIIVVLLFQLYPRYLGSNIPKFLPLIVNTLGLQAPQSAIKTHRTAYIDFLAAQVKTLSFLAYMLRGYADNLRPHQETIPRHVIQLMVNCPDESASTRKELLIATRHILATEFRTGFISQIDTLLDEKVLIGKGKTSHETLRPLAYSTLADLIHHVRQELSFTQLSNVVHLYARNIHDNTLPFAIQTMSSKLLLNLVECIARKNNGPDPATRMEGQGRVLLVRILDAFVNKFSSLKKQIPKLGIKDSKDYMVTTKQMKTTKLADTVKDCRMLVRTLVLGLKNIVWGVSSCTPSYRTATAGSTNPAPKTFSVEESLIFMTLLKDGLRCFCVFQLGPNPAPQEEKEIMDHFATVFTMTDTRIFQDVFNTHISFLYRRILDNQTMLVIPQQILRSQNVSPIFGDILLNFLVERMEVLAGTDKTASSVLLWLFKLVFDSLPTSEANEQVLQPQLANIITSALKCISENKESVNYFVLLRELFRSITNSGKLDAFFKDIIPLLPGLLEGLNKLQQSEHAQTMKDLILELALTIPVRISALMPLMRLLMRPLVLAIDSHTEIAGIGLKTLELYVDNLQSDFLDPVIDQVSSELMAGLWRHLRPAFYPYGSIATRVIGKLAGKNRRFLENPHKLKPKQFASHGLGVSIAFEPNMTLELPLDRLLESAKLKLVLVHDVEVLKQAFIFVQVCLNAMLSTKDVLGKSDFASNEMQIDNVVLLNSDPATGHVLKNLLEAVIIAVSNEKLKEQASPYFENVCNYFIVQFLEKEITTTLYPKIFIESLVDSLTGEKRTYLPTVIKAIDYILEATIAVRGSIEDASQLSVFNYLAEKLCHSCYRHEWYAKHGGRAGLHHLITKLPLPWVQRHEFKFVKAFLYIIKDLPQEMSITTLNEASESLTALLTMCNSSTDMKDETLKPMLNSVVGFLTENLSSPNKLVRSNVKKALRLLSELTQVELSQLIEPFKDPLLTPIFTKQLRTLKHQAQTGHLDALAFCLKLNPPLIPFSQELMRLLQGGVAIADKDDLGTPKNMTQKNIQILTSLRKVSIELLSAALSCSDFQTTEHQDFQNKTIGIFFKALTVRSKEIVSVAKKGLSLVISKQKLPKNLLQSSLRPVLLNLADYRKLSVPLLQGLSRLLELLTNCFNVTLGEKLLEHLQKWTDPAKLAATKIWKEGEEIRIAAAIIDIFHLLPSTANKFLDPLIQLTIQLEAQLPREVSSPYRVPLIHFLNRYPGESLDYFLQKLSLQSCSKLFRFILREESAGILREELATHPEKLIASTFKSPMQAAQLELQFQGILITRSMVRFLPPWLSQNRAILDCLIEVWQSPGHASRLANDDNVPLHRLKESKFLVKCFLNYCKHTPQEVDLLFHMQSVFTIRTTVDFAFLKDFYSHTVAETYSQGQKRAILLRFLQFFKDPAFTLERKVQSLQVIVIPMLTAAFVKNEYKEILDKEVLASLIIDILSVETKDEGLNIELLLLATLLVKFMSAELLEHRKELIKFAWNHLKCEDVTTRQCAYVLVCRFIEAYETPPKIILQVYVALLRAFQPEARHLVKQALDILTPALQKRLPGSTWIRWTKKIIVEEGHAMQQLIHILQLIVRHPSLFYTSRSNFIPHMINSLARIGLVPNSPQENRKLAVDITEVNIQWEKQTIDAAKKPITEEAHQPAETAVAPMELEEKKNQEVGADGTSTTTDQEKDKEKPVEFEPEYRASPTNVEMLVNFLIRIASTNPEGSEHADLGARSMELLKQALGIWPESYIKINFFEKLLAPVADNPQSVSTGLGLLTIILEFQGKKFMVDNREQLKNCLAACIVGNINYPKLTQSLSTLFQKIMSMFPLESAKSNTDIGPFYNFIADCIESNINNVEKLNIYNTLMILNVFSTEYPPFLDRYIPLLVKALSKFTKDHLSPPPPTVPSAPGAPGTGPAPKEAEASSTDIKRSASNAAKKAGKEITAPIVLLCQLLNVRMTQLGEHKKGFFLILTTLLEKSMDLELLSDLTQLISTWITGTTQGEASVTSSTFSPLSSADKVRFLLKMHRFDGLGNAALQSSFLDLVYFVHNDSSSSRAELTQLETGFLMGLKCKDAAIRNKFFDYFHHSTTKDVAQRLSFILATQNWDPISTTFWIRQALDLILAVISPREVQLTTLTPWKEDSSTHEDLMNTEGGQQTPFEKNDRFLSEIRSVQISQLIAPLRELMHQDVETAYNLWVTLFPKIWSNLSKEEQDKLTQSFISCLSKDYQLKQQRAHPNVAQCLMDSASQCYPPIRIPPELLKFLGKTCNVWHISIQLLENEPPSSPDYIKSQACVNELYGLLHEEDLHCSTLLHIHPNEETGAGLILERHGYWQRAQEVFGLMTKAQSGHTLPSSNEESYLWEDQWVKCAKRLSQWEVLTDYAKSSNNTDLLLDCAWRVMDWQGLKDALVRTTHPLEYPPLKVLQSFMAIQEGKPQEVDSLGSQGVQLCLRYHQSLPEIPSFAHIVNLHTLQQIVEVKESALIAKKLSGNNKGQLINEIKSILTTWRERVPNAWDDILLWNDVLTWRQHVFSLISTAFLQLTENNGAAAYIGHHETAWTINKFSHVARKHELVEVCLSSLSKIYTLPNIEIQDAFVKLREQVKCYFQLPTHLSTGLDIINSTNLDYFGSQQKAEFFQLKGDFLSKMGHNEEANTAFSTAVSIFDNLGNGWLSWALFCDSQFSKSSDISWAEYAMNCYLQAIRCGSDRARRYLPRVLWLLSYDDEHERLTKAFDKYNETLPVWIWLPSISQLLSLLSSGQSQQMKTILNRVATLHPQALYHPLRNYFFEKRYEFQSLPEVEKTAPRQALIKAMEEIMACLKATHPTLATDMETLIKELSIVLQPEPHELFLIVLKQLISRCYEVKTEEQMKSVRDIIHTVSQFSFLYLIPTTQNSKYLEFIAKVKPEFEGDVVREPDFGKIIQKLKGWVTKLQNYLKLQPKKVNLEDISPFLADFQNNSIEIPGQYLQIAKEPSPDHHLRLDRIHPEIEIVNGERRIQFRAKDGTLHAYHLETIPNIPSLIRRERTQEKIGQLLRLCSLFVHKHKETRKRNISFKVPVVVHVSPSLRLVETDVDSLNFSEIYSNHCSEFKKDEFAPLDFCFANSTTSAPEKVFSEIAQTFPEDILSNYFSQLYPSYLHLFPFKKQFASDLSVTCMMSYLLSVGNRGPDKFSVSKSTGCVIQKQFHPGAYDENGSLKAIGAVPFRLTRNIEHFLGPTMVDGVLNGGMTATAMCISHYQDQLAHQLTLFLREDLVSWLHEKRTTNTSAMELDRDIKLVAEENAAVILQRIKSIIPIQLDKASFSIPINKEVTALIKSARDPQNLKEMSSTWFPWF